jgi:hypothetical protein
MTTCEVGDTNLTPEDTAESLVSAITRNTIKLFKLLLPDEDTDTINTIASATMLEILNRIDPRTTPWKVIIRRPNDRT